MESIVAEAAPDLAQERLRLECEKLRAEIDAVRLAWWKRPGYLGGLVPVVLAALTLGGAQLSGWFDLQRSKVAADLATLESEVAQLQDRRDVLEADVVQAKRQLDIAWLSMANAAQEATYALGHAEAFQVEPARLTELELVIDTLPPEAKATIDALTGQSDNLMMINEIAQEVVDDLLATLARLPADESLKVSQSDPILRAAGLRQFPDGSYIDVETGDLLSEAEGQLRLGN